MAYLAVEPEVGAPGRGATASRLTCAISAARGETPVPAAKLGLGRVTVRASEGRASTALAADGAIAMAEPSSITIAARRRWAARALET